MPPAVLVVYVGDDGPGIPEGEREALLEQGVSGAGGGTGYGLAIVTDIVEGHGWSIEVTESDAGGACFEIGHIYSLEPDATPLEPDANPLEPDA